MIRHDDERIYFKRKTPHGRRDGRPENIDMLDQKALTPVEQVQREEPTTTWNKCAPIVGHGSKLAWRSTLVNLVGTEVIKQGWSAADYGFA
jgi:hypothetical protein